jgi:hypothetical protein
MILGQTEVILGHLVKQVAIEVLIDIHGTGLSIGFGLISYYKLVSRLLFLILFY